ncbi:MAG: hypothetical protein J7639_12250 [Paenibacillaceae bacterium]|nr:hypothetical protein [Paenibacillaceae bacterium]
MPVRRFGDLLLRFGWLYVGGAVLVVAFFAGFPLLVTSCILLVMIALLELYAYFRLKRLRKEATSTDTPAPDAHDRISRSLLRVPAELFWIIVLYGGVMIPFYHVAHYVLLSKLSLQHVDEKHWL